MGTVSPARKKERVFVALAVDWLVAVALPSLLLSTPFVLCCSACYRAHRRCPPATMTGEDEQKTAGVPCGSKTPNHRRHVGLCCHLLQSSDAVAYSRQVIRRKSRATNNRTSLRPAEPLPLALQRENRDTKFDTSLLRQAW